MVSDQFRKAHKNVCEQVADNRQYAKNIIPTGTIGYRDFGEAGVSFMFLTPFGSGCMVISERGQLSHERQGVAQMRSRLAIILIGMGILLFFPQWATAQWVQTGGPEGGNITALAVSGTNLFAGTTGGGVFLSKDNGKNWKAVNSGLPATTLGNCLLASGTNLFAGTGDGVFLSGNNGASWKKVSSGLPARALVECLAASGTNLFAGTYGGVIFLSTNNGASWRAINPGSYREESKVKCLAASGENLFAAIGQEMYPIRRFMNVGTGWKEVKSGSPGNVYATCLAVSGTNLFAGTYGGVILSIDNGSSWTEIKAGFSEKTNITCLAVSRENLFAGTEGSGVFLSTNNGASWKAVNSGLPTKNEVTCLAASGTDLFAGTEGSGVFLSTNNGASWNAVNSGLMGTDVELLAVMGANIFAGGGEIYNDNGIFLSTDNGASWTAIGSGFPARASVSCLAVRGTNLYAGMEGWPGETWDLNPKLFLSNDNGASWTAPSPGLSKDEDFRCLIVSGSSLYAGTNDDVFLSTNNGASWTAISSGLPIMPAVECLLVSGTNLFAGTSDGLFSSKDNGTSWTAVSSGLPKDSWVHGLAVSGTNLFANMETRHGNLWPSYSKLFMSADNGVSWTSVNSGLPAKTRINCLLASGTNLFAGTNTGVFVSEKNGKSWQAVNSGLPKNMEVQCLEVCGPSVFAGTRGHGVWRLPLSNIPLMMR
jgi:hypothetical protein